MLKHRFLHTLVIDVSNSRSSISTIPGSRRLMYVQRIRSRIDRKVLIDPKLRRILEDRKRQHIVGVKEHSVIAHLEDVDTTDEKEDVGNGFARVELPPLPDALDEYDDEEDEDDDEDEDEDEDEEEFMDDPTDNDGDSIMTDSPRKPASPFAWSPKRRKQLLESLDYVYLASLEPWDIAQITDICFQRRLDGDVVVYDDRGHQSGFAEAFANVVRDLGKSKSVRYLSGGMEAFAALHPYSFEPVPVIPVHSDTPTRSLSEPTTTSSPPRSRTPLRRSTTIPIPTSFPHIPITTSSVHDLREVQNHLISAVWYNRSHPVGDLPLPILPPFLYLGSCFAARPETVTPRRIRHVLRLGWGFEDACRRATAGDVHAFIHDTPLDDEGTVIYHDFPIEDSPRENIRRLFEECCGIIERARRRGEGVLVHCHAGVSRSATIVLAYLVRVGGLSLYDAWCMAYKSRPIIRPNDGFARALQDLEKEIHGVTEPSVPLFWMSESYAYFMDYLEFKERLEAVEGRGCAGGVEREVEVAVGDREE